MANIVVKKLMETIKSIFTGRPLLLNAVMLFCAYMTFIYMPFDMFIKPVAQDQEVWLGFTLTGWAAKATELLHWFIYAAGFYGLLNMKPWVWPWASFYVVQVAISMLIWPLLNERGYWLGGTIAACLFGGLAYYLWRAKPWFTAKASLPVDTDQP